MSIIMGIDGGGNSPSLSQDRQKRSSKNKTRGGLNHEDFNFFDRLGNGDLRMGAR